MSYDPVPAQGVGAEEFDQPVQFFLTNRLMIEQWAALRSDLADSVGRWYRTVVRDALVQPAAERELIVSPASGPGNYRSIVLHPADATILSGKPVIGAGFTWPSKTVDPAADSVFISIRCSRNETGRRAADQFRADGGPSIRATLSAARGTDSDAWPIWWWLRAQPNWWTDLDTYRQLVVDEVLRLVDAVRPALEAAWRVSPEGSPEENDDA